MTEGYVEPLVGPMTEF